MADGAPPSKRVHALPSEDDRPRGPGACFQFQRTGSCAKGNACKYAHEPPKLCADFAKGECSRGDKCRFSHGVQAPPALKPNFGLSGALAKDAKTGNVRKGKQVKWAEPPDAKLPTDMWRIYVFDGNDLEETLYLHRQSAFLFGRDGEVADIVLKDASCSKEHAVLQFRLPVGSGVPSSLPYIIDLESTNGTSLNGEEIKTSRYVELKDGDVLTFGAYPKEFTVVLASSGAASKT